MTVTFLTPDEQDAILRLARRTLLLALPSGELPRERDALGGIARTPAIDEPRGAFVSVHHRDGDLRGCIGHVQPVAPLWRTVMECAVAAALHDPRFPPLRADELAQHVLEISVLTVPEAILPDQVQIGRYGLIVSKGFQTGLLLPQVPVENGWDRETFLRMTCRKAGLPVDAWQRGATLLGFEAQVFGESEAPSR